MPGNVTGLLKNIHIISINSRPHRDGKSEAEKLRMVHCEEYTELNQNVIALKLMLSPTI